MANPAAALVGRDKPTARWGGDQPGLAHVELGPVDAVGHDAIPMGVPTLRQGTDGSDDNYSADDHPLHFGTTSHGDMQLNHVAIRCLNSDCNEPTINVTVRTGKRLRGDFTPEADLVDMRLVPRSSAKPQPVYIPEPIRQDYLEACLIRNDSPKASATLARRALQGMLHDFCGINERTLFHEISRLEKMLEDGSAPKGVADETIAAIHAVRKIGNIGAHMESDINVIVDVDAGDAQALIDLIELLFEEWYLARNNRQVRLKRILEIDGAKEAAKNPKASEEAGVMTAEGGNAE